MFCTDCGAVLSPTHKFCASCDNSVESKFSTNLILTLALTTITGESWARYGINEAINDDGYTGSGGLILPIILLLIVFFIAKFIIDNLYVIEDLLLEIIKSSKSFTKEIAPTIILWIKISVGLFALSIVIFTLWIAFDSNQNKPQPQPAPQIQNRPKPKFDATQISIDQNSIKPRIQPSEEEKTVTITPPQKIRQKYYEPPTEIHQPNPCVYKAVMTNADFIACGINPPR